MFSQFSVETGFETKVNWDPASPNQLIAMMQTQRDENFYSDRLWANREKLVGAILSDGTQLDTDRVSSDLMMITDDQPPLSSAEIASINYIPSLSEIQTNEQATTQELPIEAPVTKTEPAGLIKKSQSDIQTKVEVDPNDLFGMFSLEDTDLNLSIKIKLPSKNLLKMMYSNAKNKDEFLTKLANYINNSVTVDSIKKTMKKSLGSAAKSKSTHIVTEKQIGRAHV